MDNPAVISTALRGKPKFRPMHLLLTVGHGKDGENVFMILSDRGVLTAG
jgi:hypothetical protein